MKHWKLALCAAAATMAMAGAAAAQDELGISANIAVTNDYVFRGYTQTDESVAVQGGVDATYGMFYAGAWASNVDFFDSTSAEVDVYAGVTPTVGPVALNFGALYYGYIDEPDGADYGYWEFKAAGSVPVGPATLGAAVFYSPDFFGGVEEATYGEVNAAFSPVEKVSLSAAVGYQAIDGDGDYTTWNIGGAYSITDNVSIDLRYHDTDVDDCDGVCDGRVVATLKGVFP